MAAAAVPTLNKNAARRYLMAINLALMPGSNIRMHHHHLSYLLFLYTHEN